MQLFEFLMILISIIIGLGVAEVLSGAARLIRDRDSVKAYWIHIGCQVAIFLAFLQTWWECWSLRDLPQLTLLQACVLLLNPIFAFMVAYLLYPDPVPGTDLRAYYYRQSPVLWGLVAAGTASGTFLKPLPFGWNILEAGNLSGFLSLPFALILASTRRPRVHAVLAPTMFAILVLDTVLPRYLISG